MIHWWAPVGGKSRGTLRSFYMATVQRKETLIVLSRVPGKIRGGGEELEVAGGGEEAFAKATAQDTSPLKDWDLIRLKTFLLLHILW